MVSPQQNNATSESASKPPPESGSLFYRFFALFLFGPTEAEKQAAIERSKRIGAESDRLIEQSRHQRAESEKLLSANTMKPQRHSEITTAEAASMPSPTSDGLSDRFFALFRFGPTEAEKQAAIERSKRIGAESDRLIEQSQRQIAESEKLLLTNQHKKPR